MTAFGDGRTLAIGSVVVAVVARYALDVLVGRMTGPSQFGAYAVVLAYALTLASVATFGLPELANREMPVLKRGTDGQAAAFIRLGNRTVIGLGLALGLVFAAGLWLLEIPTPGSTQLLLVAMVPLTAFFAWRRQLTLIGERHVLGLLAPALVSLVAVPLAALLLWGSRTAVAALGGMAVAYAAVCLVLVWSTRRALPGRSSTGAAGDRGTWLRAGGVIVTSNVATAVTFQLDVLLISYFATPSEAGAYASAARVSLLTTLALAGIALREGPRFGTLLAAGRDQECWSHFRRSCLVSGSVGLVLAVVLVAGGSLVLGAFGSEFTVATPWLAVLLVGRLASAATGPVALQLVARGRQRVAAGAAGVGLAVAFVAICALGAAWGPVGVAAGASLGAVVQNSLQFVRARQVMAHRLRGRENQPPNGS